MNIFVDILFVIVLLLSLAEDYIDVRKKYCILVGLFLVMIIAATVKPVGIVADSESYEEMFYNNDDPLIETMTEPTYIYLSRFVLLFGGGVAVMFFVYALISVPLKLLLIDRMTPCLFTAMAIYVPVYYELHDLVQIRAAAAGAFIMMALYNYANKKYFSTAVAFVVACLFHYSSVSFLPVLLICKFVRGKSGRIAMACVVPLGFAFYFAHRDLFSLLPSALTAGKIDFYKDAAETGVGGWDEMLAPYKNIFFLFKCTLFYVYLYYYDYLSEKNRYFAPVMLAEAGSFFWLLTMSTIPVLASRVSDLYAIFDAVFFTFAIYLIEPKIVVKVTIICIGAYMLVYNMLNSGYFG